MQRRDAVGLSRASARVGQDEWARTVVLSRDGRPPDPDKLAALPALGTMSDSLLRLMEPPAPDEIEHLEAWLELGAAMWNATLEASTAERLSGKLRTLVEEWDLPGEADPVALVEEIAMRRLRNFSSDPRRIAEVRVRAEGGRATVEAATFAYLP